MGKVHDAFHHLYIAKQAHPSDHAFLQMFSRILWLRYTSSLPKSLQVAASGSSGLVVVTLFRSWYASIHERSDGYGGVIWVSKNETVMRLLAHMIHSFYGLRDRSSKMRSASAECPSMRNAQAAPPYTQDSLYLDLPFPGLMAWDVGSLKASCNLMESHFFCTIHPGSWGVSTKAGEDRSLEDPSLEVFDLTAAIKQTTGKAKK